MVIGLVFMDIIRILCVLRTRQGGGGGGCLSPGSGSVDNDKISVQLSLRAAHRTGRVYCELHLEPDSRGPSLYSPYILILPPQFRAEPVLYNKHCKLLHCMAGLTATRYLGIHFKTVELVIARTLHCCKNNSFFYKPLVPQPAPSCKSLVSSAPPRWEMIRTPLGLK